MNEPSDAPPRRFETHLASLPAWVLPAAVFALALGLRAWTLAEERAGDPLFRTAVLDDAVYLRLADDVRTGASAGRPWFLAPLYPWTLWAASFGAPPDMASAERLSVLLGALTAATAALAARAVHSATAGWTAGALYACAGAFVFQDVLPGQEPLLCLLHVAALLLAARFFSTGRPWTAAAFGAVVGVAVLGRSTSAALGAAFAVACLVHAKPRRRAWTAVALAAAGCAVVLLPAAVRNVSAAGSFTPLPWSGGPNLYLANGPEARRHTAFTSSELGVAPDSMERRARDAAELDAGRPLTASEVSAYWTKRTWDERGDDWAPHLGRKAAFFWSAAETPNNHDVGVEREWSSWLRVVPSSTWWIFALGAAGWWLARRRRPALDVAALCVLVTWAALTVFFPLARYKAPAAAVAVVLASAGAAEVLAYRVSAWRAVVAALVLVGAWRASLVRFGEADRALPLRNVAVAFDQEGDRAHAKEFLSRCLAESPDDGPARERLGRMLLDEGRAEEALVQFRLAARDGRSAWTASAAAVRALVVLSRPAVADAEGVRLLDDAPPSPSARAELLADLALASAALDDRAKASERLRAAEALDAAAPGVVRARNALRR